LAIPISAGAGRADEGISERYLQKLFEGTGDNLRHYLRDAGCSIVGDLATRPRRIVPSPTSPSLRLSDAAHFSRSFRDRFGMSRGTFRNASRTFSGLGVKTGSAAGLRMLGANCVRIGRRRRSPPPN